VRCCGSRDQAHAGAPVLRRARRRGVLDSGLPLRGKENTLKVLLTLTVLLLAGVSAQASCTSEVGVVRANQYVAHCRDVSPATRPPCNASNACSLIVAEIQRGCRFLKEDAPAYCRAYLGSSR
jgi:hypothetical protein